MQASLYHAALAAAALTLSSPLLAADPVEITFASMKTFGISTMPDLLAEFERQNPGIKVKYVEMPAPSQSTEIHQFLVTNLAGGTATIDAYTIDIIWFAEFAQAGWLLALDNYLSEDEKKQYFPGIIDGLTFNNELIGLPWFLDAGMLYYRKDLLDKYGLQPPATWDDLIKQAKTVTEGEKDADLHGFVWQGKQAEVLTCDLVEFLGRDGDVIDASQQVKIDDEAGLRATQLMQDLIYQHKVSPQAITTYDEEPSRRVFTEGNALFLRNWSYVWKIANDPKQSKVVDKVAVAPIPAFAGSGNAATLGGYQFGVNRNSKNPDAAVKLIKFLSSEDSQLYFANKINFAPTRPALYKSGKIEDPFLGSLVEVFSGAKARPVTPAYPEVTLVLQAEYSALLANQQTPQQTVTNVAAKVRSILP